MSLSLKIAPWTARPLSQATKSAKFRAMLDHHADRTLYGQAALRAGWVMGGVGITCFAASMYGWMTILPLKTTEVRFYLVDGTSGYIGPATTVEGAPTLFTEASNREALTRYIKAREGWVPEDDQSNDYLVKIMSRKDEQDRYAAWRKSPTSPMLAIGKDGHADVHNLRFHPMPSGAGHTLRYLVQFEKTTSKGGAKISSGGSVTIDFQWHPEFPMRPSDRDLNAGGFQAIAYSAEPYAP